MSQPPSIAGTPTSNQSSVSNIGVLLCAPLPSLLLFFLCRTHSLLPGICSPDAHPLVLINALFFFNVCVLFWIASLFQGSTWLIDPYWTIAPVLIGNAYRSSLLPSSSQGNARQLVSLTLLWAWSTRLTYSYFRREKWRVGAREDWRYEDMRAQYGPHWWWVSFFVVFLIQQIMIVGITLPLYSVHASALPWHPLWDSAAAVGCVLGILIAAVADNQLHNFMTANERREKGGKKPELLLQTGLWRYSRHPNYFGEQLWWWSLGLFAVIVSQPWALGGALFNTLCMVGVTQLTEARIVQRQERAALYRDYQRRTSVWVPWFVKRSTA